jgi:predicted phage terminase large subunit-like protein
LGRAPGEWLWENFYGAQHYETKRATMPAGMWSALYMGKPLDKQGEFIAEDQFQRYEKPPVNIPTQPFEWVKCVMSIDTASKGNERSDYTAIQVYRKGVDGCHYLVDAWRDKKPMDDIIKTVSVMIHRWQCNYVLIEDSGMGTQILQNYDKKFACPLVPYQPAGKGSKEFRFDAAVPWITAGKILFPKQAPWLSDLIAEFVAQPYGTNDDWADCFAQYCDHELKMRAGGTKRLRATS